MVDQLLSNNISYIGHSGGDTQWLYEYSIFSLPKRYKIKVTNIFTTEDTYYCTVKTYDDDDELRETRDIKLSEFIEQIDDINIIFPHDRTKSQKIKPINNT